MSTYDINAEWDDPCEHAEERRGAVRFEAQRKFDIAVRQKAKGGHLVGPGRLKDLSLSGASLVTKHDLKPNQRVALRFSTSDCPGDLALPRNIVGNANVVYVNKKGGRSRQVAVRFSKSLTESMEFAVFINHLHHESHNHALSA